MRRAHEPSFCPCARDGVVLVAALGLVAYLALFAVLQLERLPLAIEESRSAQAVVQRELDVNSALQCAIGLLRADARQNDYDWFGDPRCEPQQFSIGVSEVEVRIADSVFERPVTDRWTRWDLGFPEEQTIIECRDPSVRLLFESAVPNVNTASLSVLNRMGVFDSAALRAFCGRRAQSPLRTLDEADDLRPAGVDVDKSLAGHISVSSALFAVEARIRRPGEPDERRLWVVHRDGEAASVVFSGR